MDEILEGNGMDAALRRVTLVEMEEEGMQWDPEEEPLAERLEVRTQVYAPHELPPALGCDTAPGLWRFATLAELRLAADLYNRRRAIESVVRELRNRQSVRRLDCDREPLENHFLPLGRLGDLADRLEGK